MQSDQWHLIGKFTGSFELACCVSSMKLIAIVRFKALELAFCFLATRSDSEPRRYQKLLRPRLKA